MTWPFHSSKTKETYANRQNQSGGSLVFTCISGSYLMTLFYGIGLWCIHCVITSHADMCMMLLLLNIQEPHCLTKVEVLSMPLLDKVPSLPYPTKPPSPDEPLLMSPPMRYYPCRQLTKYYHCPPNAVWQINYHCRPPMKPHSCRPTHNMDR